MTVKEKQENTTLLEDWRQNLYLKTSSFRSNLNDEFRFIKREHIDYCVKVLETNSWIFSKTNNQTEKIPLLRSGNANLLEYALANPNIGMTQSIFYLVHLLSYGSSLRPELLKNLTTSKNYNDRFKDYLFEIYTYHTLDTNKISNLKGNMENGQVLEGTCSFLQKDFLFECKRLYSKLNAINDKAQQISNLIVSKVHKKPFCFMLYVECIENIKLSEYQKWINGFFDTMNTKTGEYMRLEVTHKEKLIMYSENSNRELFEALKQKSHDGNGFIFHSFPDPSTGKIGIENQFFYGMKQEGMTEQFISKIETKRKQHAKSKYEYRIFFFENEITNNMHQPLFPRHTAVNKAKVTDYLVRKKSNDVVCLIFKNFNTNKPQNAIQPMIFCKPELNEVKNKMLKWKWNNCGLPKCQIKRNMDRKL